MREINLRKENLELALTRNWAVPPPSQLLGIHIWKQQDLDKKRGEPPPSEQDLAQVVVVGHNMKSGLGRHSGFGLGRGRTIASTWRRAHYCYSTTKKWRVSTIYKSSLVALSTRGTSYYSCHLCRGAPILWEERREEEIGPRKIEEGPGRLQCNLSEIVRFRRHTA